MNTGIFRASLLFISWDAVASSTRGIFQPKSSSETTYESLPFELEVGVNVGSSADSGVAVPSVGASVSSVGVGAATASGASVVAPARQQVSEC